MPTKKISATEARLTAAARTLLQLSADLNPRMPEDDRWLVTYKALELLHGSKYACDTSHELLWELFFAATAPKEAAANG